MIRSKIFFLFFLLVISFGQDGISQSYNPSLNITNPTSISSDGIVNYTTTNTSKGDSRFTILGDGYFSTQNNFKHQFPDDLFGFTTKTFFNKKYKKRKPTLRSIGTGQTGFGSLTNQKIRMPSGANIKLGISWFPVKGLENYFILVFENTSTSIDNGCVELYYNNNEVDLNFSGIIDNAWVAYDSNPNVTTSTKYNKKLKWNFVNLNPGEQRVVYIPMTSLKNAGSILNLGSKYSSGCSGSSGAGVTGTSMMSMGSPHDPNIKIADKDCVGTAVPEPQSITYTIRFQNEGTAPAVNVILKDELDHINLDLSTLEIIESEYNYTYSLLGNKLTITFPNIQLPGLKQKSPEIYSYDDTESYIRFSICTMPNLSTGYIYNSADIYFDKQPPISTNRSIVEITDSCIPTLGLCSGAMKITSTIESISSNIKIIPNPVQDILHIEGMEEIVGNLYIYNNRGEQVYSKLGVNKDDNSVDLEKLPKGIYFIQIINQTTNITKKVLKL